MNQFTNYVELQAEKAENLSFCRGIKLLHIRDKVETMLGFIGKGGIFEEYTVHSIEHIDEMLKIVEWLIPDITKEKMTYAEWLMLTLAIYFHDLGMVVTKDEFEHRDETGFKEYKEKVLENTEEFEYEECAKERGDSFLYQEFVRENHAARIRQWIEGKNARNLGEAEAVCQEIEDILKNLDKMFKADLAMICESHHKDDIEDFSKYKVKKMYGNTENEKVNLNYIAIILRTADLLHITRDRTPSVARRLINVSNPVSVLEWEKQMAVRAVRPKDQRNEEGVVDNSKQKDTIEITAYFDGAETAEAYFGLSSYLQYTRKELAKCCEIVEKAQKREGAVGYEFPWREVDESQIEVNGFEKKKLQFTIAQDNILQLLVGHTLYNDSSVVVRELVQNGIDAVRLQTEYEKRNGKDYSQGKVWVEWNSVKRQLSFWDNGTGMAIQDVENYLLKVGASKYRDEVVKKQFPNFTSISHFGIGILTCFMVANDIDIVTSSDEQEEANSINLRKVNGSYLLRKMDKNELDVRIKQHGTMVKLYVRSDVDMAKLENDLRKWIVVPEIPVYLSVDGNENIRIGYNSLKEILIKYLNETGHDVDGEKYDVYEKKHGNVTVAYAVRHLSNIYFKSCSQYIYPLPVERTDNKQVFYNIAILDDAIRKKKKVLFEYAEYHTDKKMHLKKREDGSVREYIITPYQMAVQEGKYYLICNYDKYDDISNYRVDRIRNIQILEEKGKPFETLKWSGHQPMNLNEYMKEHVYMYSSENVFVKFRSVKAMISDVIDLFGKGVNFSEETDTHVSVSVHVNERAAEQFAKNYAPDVVILQPKRLRDKLRDDLKKAWEAYED